MKPKKELLKNTLIIGIGKFSSQIIMFLMLPLYTSYLTTNEYGTYDTLVAIATFITPFITMLLEESMFRFLIEYKEETKKTEIITITVIFHIIGIVIFSIIYTIICFFVDFECQLLFLLYVIINAIHGLSNALSRGLGDIKLYSISNFITNVLIVICNIITIAVFKCGMSGLFLSFVVGNLISAIIVFKKLNILKFIKLGKVNKVMAKKMIKYSIPLVPNSLSWSIINLSDRVMLTYMVSSSANGIYSVSNKFPQILGSVYNFFSTAWKESASKSVGDEKYYNEIYENILKILSLIVISLLIILPLCYNLFVAEDFIESYKYVPILIVAMMFSNISEFYSGIFIAYKETKIIGITTVISAVINVLINVIFITKYQILAASISTLVSTLVVMIIRRKLLKNHINLSENCREIFKYSILIIISIISFYIGNVIYNIFFAILMVIIIYFDSRKYIRDIGNKLLRRNNKV